MSRTAPTLPPPAPNDDQLEELVGDDRAVGRGFLWSLIVLGLGGLAALVVWWLLSRPAPPPALQEVAYTPPEQAEPVAEPPTVTFTDVTHAAGIDFVHVSGAYGDKLLPETMGGGNAFFDYDNDGDMDLLLVNSCYWPDHVPADAPAPTLRLYANDGAGKFTDVTAAAGLAVTLYGMGVAVGDVDRNGHVDVFITALGENRLYLNQGAGTFADATAAAGVGGAAEAWSTGAGFADIDNDGDLDLFVCNYVEWSKDIDFKVDYRFAGLGRAYGPPMNYRGSHSYLYRNEGDGRFTDISAAAGIQVLNPASGVPVGKALAVQPIDVNGDDRMDFIVANDTTQNFLFENVGGGKFREVGTACGIGFDRNGNATGAMGTDVGHYRNTRALGLFIGNFANEMTSLYVCEEDPSQFRDMAIAEGIGAPSRLMLSFGVFLFDYDLDGRLDLFQANGHLEEEINVVQPSQHYEQPAQLFWNAGPSRRGCFVTVDPAATGDLARPIVGRGASYADIDGDGDLDVLLTQVNRPPLLLRNELPAEPGRIRLTLRGTRSNPDAIGAWVVARVGAATLRRQVMPTRSYLSQVEAPVTLGLGAARSAHVTIHWPSGVEQDLGELSAGTVRTVSEPAGNDGA